MPTPSYDLYFEKLARSDPQNVCRRSGCRYNAAGNFYTLAMWGEDYTIYPGEAKIHRKNNTPLNAEDVNYLFIIQYLLNAQEIDVKHQWISEKDIPGGPTFFRGPHKIPTELITDCFGNDLEGFKVRCEALGGKPIKMGDAGYRFEITPRIPIAVIYWLGDEDFAPEAKILYDDTITAHLTSDIIYILAVRVCGRIAAA